jgi:hypothetical protein
VPNAAPERNVINTSLTSLAFPLRRPTRLRDESKWSLNQDFSVAIKHGVACDAHAVSAQFAK